jgi:hypothetical protein
LEFNSFSPGGRHFPFGKIWMKTIHRKLVPKIKYSYTIIILSDTNRYNVHGIWEGNLMERHRPFIKLATSDILSKGMESIPGKDLETYSYCVAELKGRKRSNALRNLEQLRLSTNMMPISWLEEVAWITHSQRWPQSGSRHIYLILLSCAQNRPGIYEIYVGETGKTREERFQDHKDGENESWHVQNRGIMLLPTLYSHWNSLNQEDAKQKESDIALLISASGLCKVRGGH